MAAEKQNENCIEIPTAMVGKLIGKSGETIKRLQYETSTRIQVDHNAAPHSDLKRVSVTGSREHVETAKKQILSIISADEPYTGDSQAEVECPQGIVGRIIGRGGETIRALQSASQANIVVNQSFPDGVPRKVIITGRSEAVDRAAKMVTELIAGEPGSAQAIIQKVRTNPFRYNFVAFTNQRKAYDSLQVFS